MSDISLPFQPRPDEDPRAAGVVQANLEFLIGLLQKGTNAGDILVWDPLQGKYIASNTFIGTPIGSGQLWFTTTAPTGWLLCNGSAVSRTTYAALFAVIGTTYGAGDGSTTFNLPDLRGRMPVGKGSNAAVDTLGENDGSSESNRGPGHTHTVTDPGHTHTIPEATEQVTDAHLAVIGNTLLHSVLATNSATTGITIGPGGTPPVDTPAYIVVNFIIYAGV